VREGRERRNKDGDSTRGKEEREIEKGRRFGALFLILISHAVGKTPTHHSFS
jgi:hypothetical protein